MNKTTKILSGVIALLCVGLLWLLSIIRNNNIVKSEVKEAIHQPVSRTDHKIDEHGSEHAIAEDIGISREAGDIVYGQLLDSIAKLNKLKSGKQINTYDEYSIRKTAGFTGNVGAPKIDSICGDTTRKLTFSGSNFTGTADIKSDGNIQNGKLDLTLKLSSANYWERKWFLGNRHFYQNVWSSDTTVHVDTIKHIRISEAELSRWAVTCFAGYDVLNMRPAVGVALSYELLRFPKRKRKK